MSRNRESLEIGKAIPRVDGHSKVTGTERYAADFYEGCLWAAVKRAGIPHGLLKNVDTKAARGLPGVVAVLTSNDIAGPNRQGIVFKDQPVLVDSTIRYAGDPVALVVAEDRDRARQALDLITLDYDPLPAVFEAEEALREGAPKVHEGHETGNLVRRVAVTTGAGTAAFDACHATVEAVFELPRQAHAYLETENGWARVDDQGALTIVASTQTPFRDRHEVAFALGIAVETIRVVAPYPGGAFGGKDGCTVQALLGLAALHSRGRPVKMVWDREESFLAGVKRLPARMYYRLGVLSDGTFHAFSCRLYFDTGAYASLGGEIMTLAIEHAGGPYRIPHGEAEGFCVYTNNPVGGPFRGFGVPQVTAAMEQMVDMMAERIGMDPLEIRLKNGVKRGDRNTIGTTLAYSTGLHECLQALKEHPLWQERGEWKRAAGPFTRRGVGIAAMAHAMGYPQVVPDYGTAKVELTPQGTIRVYSGVVDMGQGNGTTYLHLAGAVLGQDGEGMELVLPDTERTLPSGSASASRCTYVFGNAVIPASLELKERILEAASTLLGKAVEGLILAPGSVVCPETGATVTLKEIAATLDPDDRIATHRFVAPVAPEGTDRIYLGPHILFSYGVHLAAVEVDELTGAVQVARYGAFTDAGKVVNPQIFEQQIQGGIAQGLGYGLWEDFMVREGQVQTGDLATYIIPTAPDIPDMESVALEIGEDSGPFGLKGVGEISINGPLPAVANAIADGCGIRPDRAPFTAERLLMAMEGRKGKP